jgi:polysaccharide pyruvyl transferase WcaK-like protein
MRLHGSIFAVQKGVPVISFYYLPKNRNFMRAVGLKDYVVEELSYDNTSKLIEKCLRDRAILQEKMADYTENASKKIRSDFINILNTVK